MSPSAEGEGGGPLHAGTRVMALLGDPVRHSLSPVMQNAAFAEAGVDGVYVALRCDRDDLSGLLRGLARAGGGGNVTLPHKQRAVSLVEEKTSAVRRTGACNTFWLEDGRIHGDNTDVEGFRRALNALTGGVAGARVLLLGAGGAARAAMSVFRDDGAGEVHILNRTVSRARELASRLGDGAVKVIEGREALLGGSYELVVNATRLGLDPEDPLPLDLEDLDRVGALHDMVYRPEETRLVHRARGRGIRAVDGREMLLQQGAAAFERWWRRPAPTRAMREGLQGRLPDGAGDRVLDGAPGPEEGRGNEADR